jgi:Spy/CpxP family protein refolding chaperone
VNIRKTLVFVALSAALACGQGNGKHLGAGQENPVGGLGGFGLSSVQLDRLAEYLGLTSQQLADAKALLDKARADEEAPGTQSGDIAQQIRDAIRSSTGNFEAQIQALISSYTAAEAQELLIRTRFMNAFWNLLTPDQQQKASDLEKFLKPPASNSGTPNGPKGNNGKGNGKGNGKDNNK